MKPQKNNTKSFITIDERNIPRVTAHLNWWDRLGSCKARWGVRRMKYLVEPGLYALGNPTADSPVLVSANYKMSFDRLRSQLPARDAWILVLDTKGINVWCAAGKGTFGTEELIRRIEAVRLHEVVDHRKLVAPQLGAPGVSAHQVKRESGFQVVYGPVRAEDLPAFLDAGMKATPQMRQVQFPLRSRMALIPMELVVGIKYLLFTAACFFLLAGLSRSGYSSSLARVNGSFSVLLLLVSFLGAVVLGPIMLPWLPGRAFALKGFWLGLAIVAALIFYAGPLPGKLDNWPSLIAWLLMIPAAASFLVMNFTGASTYTSLSGVMREMRIALPMQLICLLVGVGLWTIGRFV